MRKSEEGASAVGGGGEGVDEYGRDGAVTGNDVQGGGSDGAHLREW